MLAQLRSGSARALGQQLEAAVGREHRVVRLIEADHVVGRREQREPAPDLVGAHRLVGDASAAHRLAERREVRGIGRAEVEAAALDDELLARLVAESPPEREGGAGERDVLLALVGQPDDPGRPVRASVGVPDGARLPASRRRYRNRWLR